MNDGLVSKILDLLDNIEYRRVQSSEDMEMVGRLRAKSYKEHSLMSVSGNTLIDDLDFDPHAYVFGIYHLERLISTVRVHHVTPEHRTNCSGRVFPSVIDEFLDAGMSFIDPTRLAADSEAIRELPGMNFLTMRIATMASDYFDVDRCLSLVVPHHGPFYKRMFGFKTIVPPTPGSAGPYPVPLTLMASNIREARYWIYERYPFLQAHQYEMRMMFADANDLPLTVLPTARYVSNALRRSRDVSDSDDGSRGATFQ